MANTNLPLIGFFAKAVTVVKQIAEGYDPIVTHRSTDTVIGCSRFVEPVKVIDDVIAIILRNQRTEQADFDDIIAVADSLKEAGLSADDVAELEAALVRALGISVFKLWCPGVGIKVYTDEIVGTESHAEPVDGQMYICHEFHGCQQPYGPVSEGKADTKIITIVLTLEDMPDGSKKLAFASCYPGEPDPDPDREGLVEGMVLTADEIRQRKLRPKEEKKA